MSNTKEEDEMESTYQIQVGIRCIYVILELDERLLDESANGYKGLAVNDRRRSMEQLRIDALNRTHEFEEFEKKIMSSWIRRAMHYPYSFKLASAGYTMCPWSGTYPQQFPSAELQREEVKAEKNFNKMMGAGEVLL